jgi:hypothetical protein
VIEGDDAQIYARFLLVSRIDFACGVVPDQYYRESRIDFPAFQLFDVCGNLDADFRGGFLAVDNSCHDI